MPRPAGMSSDSEDDEGFDFGSSINSKCENNYDNNRQNLEKSPNVSNGIGSHIPQTEITSPISVETANKESTSPFSPLQTAQTKVVVASSMDVKEAHKEDLTAAIVNGDMHAIKSAFANGFSVDDTLKGGWTPLMLAASRGNYQLVQFLLENGANPNLTKEMFSPLMAACASLRVKESDILQCVETLLSTGSNADACDRHRMTPVMFAAKEGRAEVVQQLIHSNVDVNKQDNKGWTAMCWAASKGYGGVIRKLLEVSASVTKTNMNGETAADLALANGYSQLADVLVRVSSGSSITIDDSLCIESQNEESAEEVKCSEMEMILSGLDLSHLVPLFNKHNINLECFLRLNEADFEKIGVDALGTRKKLTSIIAQIHKQEWKTSSLPNLSQSAFISLPEAIALVKNVNMHLRYIHASVGYLKDQIESNPGILEIGQERHSVVSLCDLLTNSSANITQLQHEIISFKALLVEVGKNRCDLTSVDAVARRKNENNWRASQIITSLIVVTSLVTIVCTTRLKDVSLSCINPSKFLFSFFVK